METIVQWNAGMSSACVCWAATKMIRLPCLCAHRNMNVITPPYPISRVVVCTCDRGFAGVYMWPSFCVRRWPHLCVHVTVGSLVCTCDRRFACAGDRRARKRSLCVHVTWICVRGWPFASPQTPKTPKTLRGTIDPALRPLPSVLKAFEPAVCQPSNA